jgi:hypothetical protein
MFNWKSGVLVAGCAVAASAMLVAKAGSWVPAAFAHHPTDFNLAGLWSSPGTSPAPAQIGSKSGDENFWLSALAQPTRIAHEPEGTMHRLAPGDRITLSGKSQDVEELEVVDVKPIDAGIVPAAVGTPAPPRLILVTCKTSGDTNAAVVRIILEDSPTAANLLTKAIHKAL